MKISNRDMANRSVKTVNETARKILLEMDKLSSELNELNRFMRVDSEEYESFSNSYKIRTAGTELIRLQRRFSAAVPALKNLSNMKYPEPLFEEDTEKEELAKQVVDKTPKPAKFSIIDSFGKEGEEIENGEKT